MKTIYAADLFCGAGGSSTELQLACKQDVVKQIGNAVPVNVAKQLCLALLEN